MSATAWAFILGALAGIVACHVAWAAVLVLVMLGEERASGGQEVNKNGASSVESGQSSGRAAVGRR